MPAIQAMNNTHRGRMRWVGARIHAGAAALREKRVEIKRDQELCLLRLLFHAKDDAAL